MTVSATGLERRRGAKLVSDGFGPIPVLIACCLAGHHDHRGVAASVGWGALAILVLAVVPYLITYRARHPRCGTSPSGTRKAVYTGAVALIAAIGLAILAAAGAPQALLAVAVSIVVTLVASAAATGRWHWSNHTAAGGAGVVMSLQLGGWWWVLLVPMVAVVGYARVRLKRHDLAQVFLGAVLGGVVSGVVLALLV